MANLCRDCSERAYCEVRCEAYFEEHKLDKTGYYNTKKYEIKGVPIMSYVESRIQKEYKNGNT